MRYDVVPASSKAAEGSLSVAARVDVLAVSIVLVSRIIAVELV